MLDHIDFSLVPTVEGNSSVQVLISPAYGFQSLGDEDGRSAVH